MSETEDFARCLTGRFAPFGTLTTGQVAELAMDYGRPRSSW